MPRHLVSQRLAYIQKQAAARGVVHTDELARALSVTERTVQRDLERLEQQGTVSRVYGGAVPCSLDEATTRLRIGLVVPTNGYYYSDVISGAEQVARQLNVQLIVSSSDYRDAIQLDHLARISELEVDGLLLTGTSENLAAGHLRVLSRPTVLVERPLDLSQLVQDEPDSDPGRRIDHVHSDHAAGANVGLQHFRELGHQRVHCVIRETPTARRLLAALRAPGPQDQQVTVQTIPRKSRRLGPEHPVASSVVARIRSGLTQALFVHHDADAIGLANVVLSAGLAVPDDVSILSYDDVLAGDAPLSLSAVAPRRNWVGRLACSTLVDRLRNTGTSGLLARPQIQISLVPELVLRGSTTEAR